MFSPAASRPKPAGRTEAGEPRAGSGHVAAPSLEAAGTVDEPDQVEPVPAEEVAPPPPRRWWLLWLK
jgi:hypothetical protein